MSMGAGGGGIFAGIGHISVLGIADANTIKVLNQILEFSSGSFPYRCITRRSASSAASRLRSAPGDGRRARGLVDIGPLPDDMTSYRIWFGVRWRWSPFGCFTRLRRAAPRLPAASNDRPRTIEWRWRRCRVAFGGNTFDFRRPRGLARRNLVRRSMLGVAGGSSRRRHASVLALSHVPRPRHRLVALMCRWRLASRPTSR